MLDALEDADLVDTTIVIVTTDHGPPFPKYKATLTDGGLGVGLILRLPGIIGSGIVSDGLCRKSIYIRPFVVLLGYQLPNGSKGSHWFRHSRGAQNPVRSVVFGEVTFHAAYEPQRSIRTERWLYIRRFGDRTKPVLPNIDQSPALDWLMEHEWHNRRLPSIQLYDNAIDPNQDVNIAGSTATRGIEQALEDRLVAWMRATGDPLLDGPVPLPPGARVSLASDRNPDGPLVTENYQ